MSRKIKLWVAVALAGVVILVAIILYRSIQPGFNPAKFGSIDYDITYCTVNDAELGMDVYYPDSGGPWPVLVFVHGGGWMEGDKGGVDTRPVGDGYLLVSINYRMYPDYRFPAMIEDVKCAVRFLRAHARQYNLDPDRIGLIGHSAGGHLVALAGLADQTAGWDKGQYLSQSSRVQAVVVISGPTNLALDYPGSVSQILESVFGKDQLVKASPVEYASPDDPPVMIIHGDLDSIVPVNQAYLLRNALDSAGVQNELLIVKNGGHGLEAVKGDTVPSGEEVYQQAILFADQYLKEGP